MFKVVIVEDEDMIRQGLRYTFDWLALDCCVVGDAADGQAGIELIRRLQPDIVMTDIRMPGMSGFDMIESASRYCRFYSIILTGYSEFEEAKRAIELNVFDYLLKPIDEDALNNSIRKLKRHVEETASVIRDIRAREMPKVREPEYFRQLDARQMNYYVMETIRYIREHYAEQVSIRKVAEKYQVSESYLSRKFKDSTSVTFTEFRNIYRVQKAAELLKEGRMRVGEISEQVGFGEYKYFHEVFKKYMGISPSEYAQSL